MLTDNLTTFSLTAKDAFGDTVAQILDDAGWVATTE